MSSAAKIVPLAAFGFLFLALVQEAVALKCFAGTSTNATVIEAEDSEVCTFRPDDPCARDATAMLAANYSETNDDYCDPVTLDCYCFIADGCNGDFTFMELLWQHAEETARNTTTVTAEDEGRYQCMMNFARTQKKKFGSTLFGADTIVKKGNLWDLKRSPGHSRFPYKTSPGAQGSSGEDSSATAGTDTEDPDSTATGTQGDQDPDSTGTAGQGGGDSSVTGAVRDHATSAQPKAAESGKEQGRQGKPLGDSFWLIFTILAIIAGILIIIAIILFIVAASKHGKIKKAQSQSR
ncbi:hypothetical protein Q1695_015370 [Nippostrongylus brasiliensis]|nr:hypothetical protein Q1695_015370 [Nippostrongylus brasiliensis]